LGGCYARALNFVFLQDSKTEEDVIHLEIELMRTITLPER